MWGMIMRAWRCLVAAAACLPAASALAEGPAADAWQFSITPYIWATALDGNLALHGNAAKVDASFIDILQGTDSIIGLEGHLEVRKGNWGAYFDGLYTRLGVDDAPTPRATIDVVNEMAILEAAAFYRFGPWPLEISPDATRTGTPSLSIEPYAGARYTYLSLDVTINDPILPLGDKGSEDWVDPIIGTRVIVDLSESWQLFLGGDVGGFGVGSEFTWSVLGLVGYRFLMFGSDATVVAGYKALYQDYENGDFVWDMTLHGPITGLVVKF